MRRFVLLALVLLIGLPLAACGRKGAPDTRPARPTASSIRNRIPTE